MLKIGDKVRRKISIGTQVEGTVIYVNPEGKFHVVEFSSGEYTVREIYLGAK